VRGGHHLWSWKLATPHEQAAAENPARNDKFPVRTAFERCAHQSRLASSFSAVSGRDVDFFVKYNHKLAEIFAIFRYSLLADRRSREV
jgi:hypothetical protein